MDFRIDETLNYILFLTRHLKFGDIPRAVTIILIDLNFEPHYDGFECLKDSISLKSRNLKLRLSDIFRQISVDYQGQADGRMLEMTIRRCIEYAWGLRREDVWCKILPERLWKTERPSNYVFIARIAYLVDLWNNCSREISAEIS